SVLRSSCCRAERHASRVLHGRSLAARVRTSPLVAGGDEDVPEWLGIGSNSTLLVLALALLASGAAVGLLSGLFGVGGVTVAVPVLYEAFRWLAVADDVRMPLCIGTSLAIIIPTSIASFLAHRRHGNVDWSVLRVWLAPILCGVILGTIVASFAPPTV